MSKGLTVMKEGWEEGRKGGRKGNDVDKEGVCEENGEGSKSRRGRFSECT